MWCKHVHELNHGKTRSKRLSLELDGRLAHSGGRRSVLHTLDGGLCEDEELLNECNVISTDNTRCSIIGGTMKNPDAPTGRRCTWAAPIKRNQPKGRISLFPEFWKPPKLLEDDEDKVLTTEDDDDDWDSAEMMKDSTTGKDSKKNKNRRSITRIILPKRFSTRINKSRIRQSLPTIPSGRSMPFNLPSTRSSIKIDIDDEVIHSPPLPVSPPSVPSHSLSPPQQNFGSDSLSDSDSEWTLGLREEEESLFSGEEDSLFSGEEDSLFSGEEDSLFSGEEDSLPRVAVDPRNVYMEKRYINQDAYQTTVNWSARNQRRNYY